MDRRVTRIEVFVAEAKDRFTAIEARLDKLQSEMVLSTRWIIGTMLAVSTVGVAVVSFVINSAGRTQAISAAVPTTQPIVIYVQPPNAGSRELERVKGIEPSS